MISNNISVDGKDNNIFTIISQIIVIISSITIKNTERI